MSKLELRRQALIRKLIETDGTADVETLSDALKVSPATVRRDLHWLGEEGLITRTYGGAVLSTNHAELDLSQRATVNAAEKNAIARYALSMVQPGMVVILDAGSTTSRLASLLAHIPGLTVFCNGLSPLTILVNADTDTTVISLGGLIGKRNRAMTGDLTQNALRRIYADIAFIGADCVHPDRGFSTRSLEQVETKSLMVSQSRRHVLLADHSKLDADWGTYWAPFTNGLEIVTDSGAASDVLRQLEARELTVHLADVNDQDPLASQSEPTARS